MAHCDAEAAIQDLVQQAVADITTPDGAPLHAALKQDVAAQCHAIMTLLTTGGFQGTEAPVSAEQVPLAHERLCTILADNP